MVAIHVVREPPADWRKLVFGGGLVVVTQVGALAEFIEYARTSLRDAFGPGEPLEAQERLGTDEFATRIPAARAAFRRDLRARALLRPVLTTFGLDPARTFWDRLSLRILPAGALPEHVAHLALDAHRDTWSSNVYPQVNWWLPLHHVTAERTIAFYPRHWTTPIPNASADWDLHELRRQRADGATIPLVPASTCPPDPADAVTVVIQPGDLLLFSGAHLHATVPNSSDSPRYSVEVRTVVLDDVLGGRGAPNIDGSAPRVPWDWFRRVEDGARLSGLV